MSSLTELYHKHAPRWVKVIRWREWGNRVVAKQKYLLTVVWLPMLGAIYCVDNMTAQIIAIKKPQTEEELMTIKQNWNTNFFQRNWELGQYLSEIPPLYDLAVRRKNYPEYYGERYNKFKRTDEFGELPKLPNYGKELVRD